MPDPAPKILFFAQRFPPSVGGTPTVLRNLLEHIPTEKVGAISLREPGYENQWEADFPQARLKRPNKIIRKIDKRFFSLIPWFAFAGARLIPKRQMKCVIGVFPYPAFALAAWLLARWRKVHFCLYMMDMWEDNAPSKGREAWFARRYEPKMVKTAHRIFCISELLAGHLREKYPACADKIITLPHPMGLDEDSLPTHPPAQKWKRDDDYLIVYSGQVYGCTADPIQTLVKCLDQLSDLNPKVIISTPDSEETLKQYGLLDHPRVSRVFLDSSEDVFSLQCEADLLFNPVSFTYRGQLQVETIFPTKTFEYLKTGNPMLVCGPEYSGFVQFAREKAIGTVLTSRSGDDLVKAVRHIAHQKDFSLQRKTALNLLKEYSPQTVADTLFRELKLET